MEESVKQYRIVFQGKLVPGHEKAQVVQNLAKLYKSDPQQVESLFSGKPTVIKRHLPPGDAKKYVQAFTQAGAIVSLQAEEQGTQATRQPNQVKPPQPNTKGKTASSPARSKRQSQRTSSEKPQKEKWIVEKWIDTVLQRVGMSSLIPKRKTKFVLAAFCVYIVVGVAFEMISDAGTPSTPPKAASTSRSPSLSSNLLEAQNYGEKWPLTVSRGIVRCDPASNGLDFITFEANGVVYAVNGTAQGVMAQKGWKRIDAIWKADPTYPDLKINISPIIDAGFELCD